MNDRATTTGAAIRTELSRRSSGALVGRIAIDNPAKLNVLDRRLSRQLGEAVRALGAREDVRALVLSGAGVRAFIGGADIAEMAALDPASARGFIGDLHAVCLAIREAPVPVIARIEGYCLGGGMEIAASCDMRAAAEGAVFGMPEVRVGIPSVIEAALLPRLIGWGKTRELLLTGRTIDAAEALSCGFLEKLTARSELDAAVERWLEAIVAAGPQAVRLQKALIRKWETSRLDEAVEAGIDAFAQAYATDEPRRLMEAFLNRPRRS